MFTSNETIEPIYNSQSLSPKTECFHLLHEVLHQQFMLVLKQAGMTEVKRLQDIFHGMLQTYALDTLLGEEFVTEAKELFEQDESFQSLMRSWSASWAFQCNCQNYNADAMIEDLIVSISGNEVDENMQANNATSLADAELFKDYYLVSSRVDVDNPHNTWFMVLVCFLTTAYLSDWVTGQ